MKKLKIGVIGLGSRGYGMMKRIAKHPDIEVIAVCDEYPDRVEKALEHLRENYEYEVMGDVDYRKVLEVKDLEAVYVATAWESHVKIAIEALAKGIPTGLEVGGAYSIEECWDLVRTWEKTKTPFMFMENCCFGKDELLATSMARAGLFGEIIHCSGAYAHDLREEITNGNIKRHYRLRNYRLRNCENYPTHELGPIAKILDINRGNRILTVSSFATKAAGLKSYIEENKLWEQDPTLANTEFAQGDVVHTILTCAGGQTIVLKLDTTLPRSYSRELNVRGTKGLYNMDGNMVFIDKKHEEGGFNSGDNFKKYAGNTEEFEDYLPDIWKNVTPQQLKEGHGGMDYFELRAFFESVMNGTEPPIDVYDAATWMAVSALSEQSIKMGGAPVAMPDFTCGEWVRRERRDVVEI